jgi:hypothetical protein
MDLGGNAGDMQGDRAHAEADKSELSRKLFVALAAFQHFEEVLPCAFMLVCL